MTNARPTPLVDFNPFSPDLHRSPYAAYQNLRDHDPVQWNPVINAWIVTRMAEMRAIMLDPAFEAIPMADVLANIAGRSGRDYGSLIGFLDAVLFFKDGAQHARDRRTMATVMNRVRLSDLEPVAAGMIRRIVAAVPREKTVDAIAELAEEFPQTVMAYVLGLPAQDVPTLSALLSDLTMIFDPASLSLYDRLKTKVDQALALVSDRIDKALKDGEENGLTVIYGAADGDHPARRARAAATVLFAYRVGAETTIGLLATLTQMMIDDPAVSDVLRREPALIERFVSEALRLESNVQRAGRVATADRELAGITIARGDRLLLLVGAANRDGAAFPNGDEIHLERGRAPDLAFGAGKHFCLGASLARMEGRLFVSAMLDIPTPTRAGDEVWYPGRTVRRLTSLPIKIAS